MSSCADPHELAKEHASDEVAEISTQLLATHLDHGAPTPDTVDPSLQVETTELRAMDAGLRSHLKALELVAAGILFGRFRDLPVEIRFLIWTIAMSVTQIHIIGSRFCSRSRINIIMQTCREAQQQGLALNLSYFRVSSSQSAGYGPNNYMHFEDDTIWLCHDIEPPLESRVKFYCSACPLGRNRIDSTAKIEGCHCGKRRLGGLALNDEDQWTDFQLTKRISNQEVTTITMLILAFNPQHLYFVLDTLWALPASKVTFVQPKEPPHEFFRLARGEPELESWHALCAAKTKMMEFFKARHTGRKRSGIKNGKAKRLNLMGWTIPFLHYVEAQYVKSRSIPPRTSWMMFYGEGNKDRWMCLPPSRIDTTGYLDYGLQHNVLTSVFALEGEKYLGNLNIGNNWLPKLLDGSTNGVTPNP